MRKGIDVARRTVGGSTTLCTWSGIVSRTRDREATRQFGEPEVYYGTTRARDKLFWRQPRHQKSTASFARGLFRGSLLLGVRHRTKHLHHGCDHATINPFHV